MWRCYGCPLFQAGLYLCPLYPTWQVLYSSLKDAAGFGELNPSRVTGCPPQP